MVKFTFSCHILSIETLTVELSCTLVQRSMGFCRSFLENQKDLKTLTTSTLCMAYFLLSLSKGGGFSALSLTFSRFGELPVPSFPPFRRLVTIKAETFVITVFNRC